MVPVNSGNGVLPKISATPLSRRARHQLELQHLWFELHRDPIWESLALVPVDEDMHTLGLARSLGEIAARHMDSSVLVVNASLRAHGDATKEPAALRKTQNEDVTPPPQPDAKVAPAATSDGVWQLIRDAIVPADGVENRYDYLDLSRFSPNVADAVLSVVPHLLDVLTMTGKRYTTALYALDSVVWEPRAIALSRSVDRVVVCLKLGSTSFQAARRVAEILGPDRLAGSVLFRPRTRQGTREGSAAGSRRG